MVTATASGVMFSNQLKDKRYQIIHVVDRGEHRVLREAAEFAGLAYKDIDLSLVYPIDVEEIFKSLPDVPGVMVIKGYDSADPYLQDLINFTVLYYEYRVMITAQKGMIPVSNKWKFVILAKPGYWFRNTIIYARSFHFDFGA